MVLNALCELGRVQYVYSNKKLNRTGQEMMKKSGECRVTSEFYHNNASTLYLP